MWVYVSLNLPFRSKKRKAANDSFVRELVKDGFSKLYPTMYVRYCTSLGNALIHKKRVMERLLPYGNVSVIIVADQQSDLAYHYCGIKQNEKNELKLPKVPSLIEFF